jgi:hypothetical protein
MQAQLASSTIFNTVPTHDYLGILKENNPSQKVVEFLKFNKEEVASATGVPKASIRYDERIPNELTERLQEIGIICELVANYFKGNLRKTALWFQIKNPALGNISPRDMIRYGRYQKLEKFIQNALAGDTP